ncbi:hypothetical protein DEJ28_13890 [Curtobacterium sp. MCPF17_002]|uniref:hypothetical protein n=1 Tax=Curtobacterium sp. MCPF17_002 TaxID=2175645 RepID=UPI000DA9705C|nr:hypothetical protein [Curtobacterium sp. MCPF17_002]WIB76735.1 hypothetical protein DEJ28_13890 [Curtobacterium sp. MCPF17_002]
MTTVRAPRWERIANAVVFGPVMVGTGIVLAWVTSVPESSAKGFVLVLGVALVAAGVLVAVRAPRVAVHLSEDTLRYDGFLISWEARRADITSVLDDAFVEWRDSTGTQHRRQLWLLVRAWEDDGTRFARLWRWRRTGLMQVREWAGVSSS